MRRRCSFQSFFLGGFECSTQRQKTGRRLDLIESTCHDTYAEQDYRRLQKTSIRTCRDGVRWHLIETQPYTYDFSSLVPMLRAARKTGTQVIWDLFHYGWPEDLDIFEPEWVRRFAAFSRAVAHVVLEETGDEPYFCAVNEISFVSWAAGDKGIFNPFATGRGNELKSQLVRATIEAMEAIWSVAPDARFAVVDPLIHIAVNPALAMPSQREAVEAYNRSQFDAWDMIAGRLHPELGGNEKYVDIIGVNYYIHNQWLNMESTFIERTHPSYMPFAKILRDVWIRYRRPIFIAETGIEDERRPEWLGYMCDEVADAIDMGVPMEGICLYPIVNHPGWEDDRHCHNGLWDYCDPQGKRDIYAPLAEELQRQTKRFAKKCGAEAPDEDNVGISV